MSPILGSLDRAGKAKAMANGIALVEELLDEFLVDDGHRRRIQLVLRREAASHDDMCANGVKVLRGAFHPGSSFIQIRLALNFYARSPVVLLHWRVGGKPDFENAGNGVEAVDDGLVEELDLCILITGRLRINVRDVAISCIQFHVDVLGFIEALYKQARDNKKHE